MYFLLFILLSENNAIANFQGESRHDTVLLHDCLRPRVQRHKNFTHCHVMNIMATNGISLPLATNSLTSSLSLSLFVLLEHKYIYTRTRTHTYVYRHRTRRCPLITGISRRLIVGFHRARGIDSANAR